MIGLSIQTYYSIQHIQAAAYLARQAKELEVLLESSNEDRLVVLKAYVASSVFSAVAFLEALANELFADADLSDGGHLSCLAEVDRRMIGCLGLTRSVQKESVLNKFDILLKAANRKVVSRGMRVGQDASALVSLRNELIHYKASFFDVGTDLRGSSGQRFEGSPLEKQILGKFDLRACSSGQAERWLGAGLAQWAVSTVLTYADTVFKALEIVPIYDHVRMKLII